MTEYGIFTDEGCIERDFNTYEKANKVADEVYFEDDTHIGEMCDECGVGDCECESGYCDCMEEE